MPFDPRGHGMLKGLDSSGGMAGRGFYAPSGAPSAAPGVSGFRNPMRPGATVVPGAPYEQGIGGTVDPINDDPFNMTGPNNPGIGGAYPEQQPATPTFVPWLQGPPAPWNTRAQEAPQEQWGSYTPPVQPEAPQEQWGSYTPPEPSPMTSFNPFVGARMPAPVAPPAPPVERQASGSPQGRMFRQAGSGGYYGPGAR